MIPKYCLDTVKLCFGFIYEESRDTLLKNYERILNLKKQFHDSQLDIINFALTNKSNVTLLHGPPGTGKSFTLTEIVSQYVQRKQKVLVTSYSNTGVNSIASSLLLKNKDFSFKLLRSGKIGKIADDIKEIMKLFL